jgi:hypothetical protein
MRVYYHKAKITDTIFATSHCEYAKKIREIGRESQTILEAGRSITLTLI